MNYKKTLEFLFSSLPMYQRVGKAAYKSDLETTLRLDDHTGRPHREYKTIHIAGTNGKGSVSHMLASILHSAGYRTGLYTSPHLLDFRERIRVNGKMIEKNYIIDFVRDNKKIIDEIKPSFFEMTVAMALLYFKDKNVDIAVIETGMGGRLDSTNIITPEISVITNIGMDHTQYLGDTPEKIALEKAGIIKRNIPVVIGSADNELRNIFAGKAAQMNSDIYFADDRYELRKIESNLKDDLPVYTVYKDGSPALEKLGTDMLGNYQAGNIVTVLRVIEKLGSGINIDSNSIRDGLMNVKKNTGFMGRWEIIRKNPTVICDSGHNPDGLRYTVGQLLEMKTGELHFVIGIVSDKDADSILCLLPAGARYYFTRASIPRAMNQDILREKADKYSLKGDSYIAVEDAYNSALSNAENNDIIYIGGSTFVVADFLQMIKDKQN